MKKCHVLFIVLMGSTLVSWAFTLDSPAAILATTAVKNQSQLAIGQAAAEQPTPFTLVKRGGGKGKRHHGAKGSGTHKGQSEHEGNGKNLDHGHKGGKDKPEGVGRSNSGDSQLRGLDRADSVAGEHGQHGRAKARSQHGGDHDEGKD